MEKENIAVVMGGAVEPGSVFKPPTGDMERAGTKTWKRLHSPYDLWMEEEGVPIFRGIGFQDARDLPWGDWKRLGGRGCYIQFDGAEELHGMYVIEVPPRGALNPERHIYDEDYYVLEGRGTTEVWYEGDTRNQSFEWAEGTLFTVPTNSYHRLVNASSSRAVLIGMTTAPNPMNEFPDKNFIFENPYKFADFGEDYYKSNDQLEVTTYSQRAARRSNIIPDLLNCELPLDNQRLPGFRRIEPYLGSGLISHIVWGYPSGRYSRAHGHSSGAIIILLRGRGYTLNWPVTATTMPWENGFGDQVNRTDYGPGGMVTAAPGGGAWFHQHFACSKVEPRFLVFSGSRWRQMGATANRINNVRPGEEYVATNVDMEEGGGSISYPTEDPMIRKIYQEELTREGAEFTMPESMYNAATR